MNNLVLIGAVIAAPTIKTVASDKQLATFLVQVDSLSPEEEPWNLAVSAWGKTAETAKALAVPGQSLVLVGSLKVDKNRPPELQITSLSTAAGGSIALVGRAGRDPEVRYFESGSVVAKLTLAVNRRSRDDEPDWFNLEIWGKQAQVAADYVRKGSLLGITGLLKLDRWTDRTTGEERSKPVVRVDRLELLGSRRDAPEPPASTEEVPF